MSKKLSGMKVMLIFIVMFFLMWTNNLSVEAKIVREQESNNTKSEAQLILANAETAEDAVNDSGRPGQHTVSGSIGLNDEDWFKVQLSKGMQYVTLNSNSMYDSFNIEVFGPDNNSVYKMTYLKTVSGTMAFRFIAPMNGYYYVRILPGTTTVNYLMLIGTPTYTVEHCEIELERVIMENRSNFMTKFNLQNISSLPEGAIVYMVTVRGVGNTAVKSISLKNLDNYAKVDLNKYSWNKNELESLNMLLKSEWEITYGYNKDIEFTPTIVMYFVYPILSTEL